MVTGLPEARIHCPFCGEALTIVIDTSAGDQAYVEDCQVCCRPMRIAFTTGNGELLDVQVSCES